MEEREGKREVWKKLFLLRQPEVSFEQEQEIFCNQKKKTNRWHVLMLSKTIKCTFKNPFWRQELLNKHVSAESATEHPVSCYCVYLKFLKSYHQSRVLHIDNLDLPRTWRKKLKVTWFLIHLVQV